MNKTLAETLLLVDDNEDILEFLSLDLGQMYKIITAENGIKAIEILKRETVHLIISDVMMPEMDGFELCSAIKSDVETSHIPVILLTAKNTIQSKIEGLHSGADVYVEKPFSIEYLTAQIESLLKNRNKVKDYFANSPLASISTVAYSKKDIEFVEMLNKYINENITDHNLDVDHIAKHLNVSRPTLYRKISSVTNLSPNEMINLSRLKKAAELLRDGYRINEVCDMVGFSSATQFGRNFQKQFNITPSEFVKKITA